MCRSLELGKSEKIFTEKLNFEGLGKFCKKSFLWEKILENFFAQEFYSLHILEISAKFRFFWYPARSILKKFFSTLLRDGAVFLKVKSSNKIETYQYLKKRFL
jgi:hypothetical protein